MKAYFGCLILGLASFGQCQAVEEFASGATSKRFHQKRDNAFVAMNFGRYPTRSVSNKYSHFNIFSFWIPSQ